jgi:transposase-like protein
MLSTNKTKGEVMDNYNNKAKEKKFQDALVDEKDFLKNIIQDFCQNLLEEEMEEHLGAKKYERTDIRQGHRNGYKPRMLKTRVGTLNLLVPQDRDGNFSTDLFNRYQRSEKALVLTLMEMYVKGISTRKVADVTEKLCGSSFSSSTISSLASKLDAKISAWNARPLNKAYPYLLVDTTYIKSRIEDSVLAQGAVIVAGIDGDGYREILAVEMIDTETTQSYERIFKTLKARGLTGLKLVISDDNKGLVKAVKKHFLGTFWQRCSFHFIKNVVDLVPRKKRKLLAEDLKAVFSCSSKDQALNLAREVSKNYSKYCRIDEMLTCDILDVLTFMDFPVEHRRRIRTVNLIERLNSEIKRRTNVVRIFPNPESAKRLISAICMEQNEEWISGRKYLNMDCLKNYTLPELKINESSLVSLT